VSGFRVLLRQKGPGPFRSDACGSVDLRAHGRVPEPQENREAGQLVAVGLCCVMLRAETALESGFVCNIRVQLSGGHRSNRSTEFIRFLRYRATTTAFAARAQYKGPNRRMVRLPIPAPLPSLLATHRPFAAGGNQTPRGRPFFSQISQILAEKSLTTVWCSDKFGLVGYPAPVQSSGAFRRFVADTPKPSSA